MFFLNEKELKRFFCGWQNFCAKLFWWEKMLNDYYLFLEWHISLKIDKK